jgi:hypothetical protein
MKVFTVHRRPWMPDSAPGGVEDVVFVKEGFSWPAFFIPFIWLIVKRMWLILVLTIAAFVGIFALAAAQVMPEALLVPLGFAFNLFFGLEGNGLRRWTLRRRGYEEVAAVTARNIEAAEFRYFASRSAEAPASVPAAAVAPAPAAPPVPPVSSPPSPPNEAAA